MAILTSLRPFQRLYDGLQIELRLDEWPADVPLPAGSTMVGIGENHKQLVPPNWHFKLEPDATIEVVGGWFKVPLSLEEVVAWHTTTLTNLGWVQEDKGGFVQPRWAVLHFCHPQTTARLRLSIRRRSKLNDTIIIIERAVKHPWSPADELAAETEVPSLPAEPT